jgi:hypothetical protein
MGIPSSKIKSAAIISVDVIILLIALIALLIASLVINNDRKIILTGQVTGSGEKNIVTNVVTNSNLIGLVTSVGNRTMITPGSIISEMLQSPYPLTLPTTQQIFISPSSQAQIYTTPNINGRVPIYLRIQMVGAGSGGASSVAAHVFSATGGSAGTSTYFGTNSTSPELICGGGQASTPSNPSQVGIGGIGGQIISSNLGYGFQINGISGSDGSSYFFPTTNSGTQIAASGAMGGPSPFLGSVLPVISNGSSASYGGGGSSGGSFVNKPTGGEYNNYTGGAGGSGAYLDFFIPNPLSPTYIYYLGTGGAGGQNGTTAGGNGGNGCIVVTEYYQ